MRQRAALVVAAVLVACLTVSANHAGAVSIFWNTATSGAWSDSTNWNPMQVPDTVDVAFINVAGTYAVTLDELGVVSRAQIGNVSGTQTFTMNAQHLQLQTATPASSFSGGSVINITNGSLIDGPGTLNVSSRVNLTDSDLNVKLNLGGVDGDLIVNGTSSHTGVFSLNVGGLVNVQSGTFTIGSGFTANDQISLTGAGSTLSVTSGALTVGSTGSLNSSGIGAARTLDAVLSNQGAMVISANLDINRADADHINSGSITSTLGSLTVTQSGASPSFTNTGTLALANTTTFTAGTVANSGSGVIRGTGTLDVSGATFTNGATVRPGTSAGTISLIGDYTQSASGTYACEIGGLTPGSGHDQLNVTGTATLDGTLDVSLINAFSPSVGDTFIVMTYAAVAGVFADTSSLAEVAPGVALEQDYQATQLVLRAVAIPLADNVAPVDPGICISPSIPCMTIDFEFNRTVSTAVRAFTVTFELSPELELCNGLASITEGPYLSGFCGGGCTVFQKNDNGDGTFTVDCAILGANCGPTSSPGELFSINVQAVGVVESGSISVNAVTVRDCSNAPVPGDPGPGVILGVDETVPTAITDLVVVQDKSGNDTDGTTAINLTFTGNEAASTLEIFRKGYGDYPEYQSGSAPTAPTSPANALANGWTLTGITTSGQNDEPATRDYWYYVAFITSPCDLVSPPSNMTGGTLNYHLGDVSDGAVQCQGDNAVGSIDISFLGANYFTTGGAVDAVNCLDVGPTDDASPDGLPQTDNNISFEDLLMFAINFGQVSRPANPAIDASADAPRLLLQGNEIDGVLYARLTLEGNLATVKGSHSVVNYDAFGLELIEVAAGSLVRAQNGAQMFFKHKNEAGAITIDTALMGRGLAIEGSGELALLKFRVLQAGARPDLAVGDLRDLRNQSLDPSLDQEPPVVEGPRTPATTGLLGARPNPAAGRAEIWFQLAEQGSVRLNVYDVSGRQIRSLANGVLPAGEHSIVWDSNDDAGRPAGSGIYFYTFRYGDQQETRKLYLTR